MKDVEFGEYVIKELSEQEFRSHYSEQKKVVFADDIAVFCDDYLTEDELNVGNALNERLMNGRLAIYLAAFTKEDEFAGWSYGFQNDHFTYYMCNSGVLEAHRRKGVYNKLLDIMVERATELGFQRITSRHNATNNAVIIPKLKKGFVITSLELNDFFGTLVHLRYQVSPMARELMDFRCGQKKPSKELLKILDF